MRFELALPVWLSFLIGGSLGQALRAQDSVPPAPAATFQRVDSIMNAPEPSEHAGLLGKIYMQDRYQYQSVDNSNLRQIDKSWQGFDTLINLPAITFDTPTPLDVDVFFGYTNVGLKGNKAFGPPLNATALLNSKTEAFSVGASIYPTLSTQWRPFVQVGAKFLRSDTDFSVNAGALGSFADNTVNHETKLLLNAGFEYDLLDSLAYRMTLHGETKHRFQDSAITNDLILWPVERIFLRGGLVSTLDGSHFGFSFGGGLAF